MRTRILGYVKADEINSKKKIKLNLPNDEKRFKNENNSEMTCRCHYQSTLQAVEMINRFFTFKLLRNERLKANESNLFSKRKKSFSSCLREARDSLQMDWQFSKGDGMKNYFDSESLFKYLFTFHVSHRQ